MVSAGMFVGVLDVQILNLGKVVSVKCKFDLVEIYETAWFNSVLGP